MFTFVYTEEMSPVHRCTQRGGKSFFTTIDCHVPLDEVGILSEMVQ
jgi:hypothetical protein